MKTKQMKKVVVSGLILVSFILLHTPLIQAEEGKKEWNEKKRDKGKWEDKIKEVHQKLGVTPEQEQKLKEHREKNRSQMEALRGQLKEKREAIRQEFEKADFNEARIRALHNELKALQDQKEELRLEGILEVRKILTPEQFKKFMEMKKDKMGFGKGERHGKYGKHDKNDENDQYNKKEHQEDNEQK